MLGPRDLTTLLLLCTLTVSACGDAKTTVTFSDTGSSPTDTGGSGSTDRGSEPATDTGARDTGAAADTGLRDTGAVADTGTPPTDTGQPEDAGADTTRDSGTADTRPPDTGTTDTVGDTQPVDTGADTAADTGADTAVADTSGGDTGGGDTGPMECPYETAGATAVPYSQVFIDVPFSGTSPDLVQFVSDSCSDDPESSEIAYELDIESNTEIYVMTDCEFDCEVVITKGGCSSSDIVTCQTTIGEEEFSWVLSAGFHYLFVEGDNPGDEAPFSIMINRHNLDGQADCDVEAVLDVMDADNCDDPGFGSPRYHLEVSGNLSVSDVDDFFIQDLDGCTFDDAHVGGGPDVVYQFAITSAGARDVDIALDPDGFDGLVYLTSAPCGARSSTIACNDDVIGGESISVDGLAPGTYYVVVDGFGEDSYSEAIGDDWGDFTLTFDIFDDACNE